MKQVVISGLITDQCVARAIRDASVPGCLVTRVTDACATCSAVRHAHSIRRIQDYCRQVTTAELAAELSAPSA